MEKIVGVAGLGIMGGAIAANLRERGWAVYGFDVVAARGAEAQAAGVELCASVGALAQKAPLILTSLPSAKAAADVATAIAASGAGRRAVVEMSTLGLDDKLAFARVVEAAGHVALDCPLSGTGSQAKKRDLVVYASGDHAALAEVMPVFADFAKSAHDTGVYGNGSRLKFIANLLVAIHNVASAEAVLLGAKAGLDPKQVVELISAGVGTSRVFDLRAPMMAEGRYEPPTMRVSTWKKDMTVISAFARDLDCPTPLFTATEAIYAAAMSQGLGDQDTAAVYAVMQKLAGLQE